MSSFQIPVESSPGTRFSIFVQLPDEILVNIGKHVAKLCGARDYCRFSQTAQRTNSLLMRKETINIVLEEANTRFQRNRSSLLLPSLTDSPMMVHSLQQLAFLECVLDHTFLEENRFHARFGAKVREILNRFPSAALLLDAHSGDGDLMAITPYGHFDYRAKHAYEKIVSSNNNTDETSISPERVRIRVWGRTVAEPASESDHPYGIKARKGKGWVEFFFQLEDASGNTLELPPRPDFYNGLQSPEFQHFEIFVDEADSSDSSNDEWALDEAFGWGPH